MTTIIYKKGKVYADRAVTDRGTKYANGTTKIKKIEVKGVPAVFAHSGALVVMAEIEDWLTNNPDTKYRPNKGLNYTSFVVFKNGRLILLDQHGACDMECDTYVMGSGSDYALGALAAGASPKRAIEIAAEFDGATSAFIDTLTV